MQNTETFLAEIKLNNQDAKNKIRELEKEIKREEEAYAEMTKEGTKASKEAIQATRKRIVDLKNSFEIQKTATLGLKKNIDDLSNTSYKELSKIVKSLNKELRSGSIEKGSEKWELYTQKIRECRQEMKKFDDATKPVIEDKKDGLWKRTIGVLNKNWGAITQILSAITGISMTIRKAVKDYASMEQEMANVRKYTGQAKEEVEEMNEDFKKMDTRTSREELNQLAGAAGRLGIQSKKDIEEFVDAADKIGVALGDDLGQGAVDTIGKLAIAFGESDRLGLRGAMLATGSALNEIVQNSSAQAQPVVEFTKALSGVGQQAHMTQAAIMGFASALDQNNQEMATSSTVMSQLITKMYQDPAKFAKMAGMNVKKFASLVKNDMNQALIEWFQQTNKMGDMSVLARAFDKLGMDGTRAVGVLATLAGHIDQVTEAQRIATEAYEKADSVIKEFNVQNETIQAGLDKAKKRFMEMSIELGEKLLPIVRYTISSASLLVKGMSVIADFTLKHSTAIAGLTAAYVSYLAIEKADLAVTASLKAIKTAYGTVTAWLTVQTKAYSTAMALERDAIAGCSLAHQRLYKVILSNNALIKASVAVTSLAKAAYYAMTLQFREAGAAMKAFNLIAKANPWGMVATAITVTVAAVVAFTRNMKNSNKATEENAKKLKELHEAQKQVNDIREKANESVSREKTRIEQLTRIMHGYGYTLTERNNALKALQKIVPSYHASITKEGKIIDENKGALEEYLKKLNAVAVAQAAFDKLAELNKKRMDAMLELSEREGEARATNKDIANGMMNGKYQVKTERRLDGQGGEYYVTRTDKALAARKEELKTQEEAVAVAKKKVEATDAEIKAVQELVNSNKEYKKAMDDIAKGEEENQEKHVSVTYHDEKEEKKKAAAKKKRIKEAADMASASYQEQLANEMLSYRKGLTSYREYMDNKHALVQAYYDRLKGIYGEDSNEYKKLLDNREREEADYLQWTLKQEDNKIIRERMEREHALQMQFLDKTNKEAYQNQELLNENIFQSEMTYIKQKQNLYHQGSKEWEEWEVRITEEELKHKAELEENYAKRLNEYRSKFSLMSAKELESIELESAKKLYDTLREEGKMTEDEYKRIVQEIKQEFAELEAEETANGTIRSKGSKALDIANKKAGTEEGNGGTDLVSAYGSIMGAVEHQTIVNDRLKELYEQGAIDYETFEEAKRQNARETAATMIAETTNAVDQISQMMGSVSSFIQACSDLETARISKNYEAQIAAAGNNSQKREKLEQKRDEAIRKAKTEANKKAMGIEIAQAFASTAMAAINAYASAAKIPVTGWMLAPIAAGMATAAGMMQIATIKKQHQAEEAGYYEGGFTGGRMYRKTAGVVHEGEFVSNHQAVENPHLTPLFNLLDVAQRNNRVGSLTARDVTNAMGGPASTTVVPVVNIQSDNTDLKENLDSVSEAVGQLNEILQDPIHANISMQDLDEKYTRYKKLLKNK